MGKTRLNKMGRRSSHARLSTLGTTRIHYCESEEHSPTNPSDTLYQGIARARSRQLRAAWHPHSLLTSPL
jgi:hypothetical protein